uniref:Uncharacterized protein n=1 Tax=Schizaphis graminum TaxID=13262 RepID=A0A2S2PJB8_SCHGA
MADAGTNRDISFFNDPGFVGGQVIIATDGVVVVGGVVVDLSISFGSVDGVDGAIEVGGIGVDDGGETKIPINWTKVRRTPGNLCSVVVRFWCSLAAAFKKSVKTAAMAVPGKTFDFGVVHRTRGAHFELSGLVELCAEGRDGAVGGAPEHSYNHRRILVITYD